MEFVRGDTFIISRYFKDKDGNNLILNKNTDEINFTMRKDIYSEVAVIEKHINDIEILEDGKYRITLNPKDTEQLEFGEYGYDIELIIGKDEENPFVRTVESGTIKLLEQDYSRPNEVV